MAYDAMHSKTMKLIEKVFGRCLRLNFGNLTIEQWDIIPTNEDIKKSKLVIIKTRMRGI